MDDLEASAHRQCANFAEPCQIWIAEPVAPGGPDDTHVITHPAFADLRQTLADFGVMASEGEPMDERWRAVGRAIEDCLADTGATWTAFYVASGVSEPTISGIRKGRPVKRRDKRRGICRALGWSPDSIDRMLRGEDPIVATSAAVITERPDIVSGAGVVSQPYVTADQLAALQEQVDRLQLALERLAKLSAQGAARARSRSRVRRDSGQSS